LGLQLYRRHRSEAKPSVRKTPKQANLKKPIAAGRSVAARSMPRARSAGSEGTRQMVELIELGAGHDWDRLRAAVEQTLSMSCHDAAAIQHSDERRETAQDG
jgi:hypothetical protein